MTAQLASRPLRARAAALAVVLAALAAIGAPRAAAAEPQPVLGVGGGLTAPAGATVDAAGQVWVADEILGICRVVPGVGGDPGSLTGPFCVDPATTLRPGPVAPSGIAFQSTGPGTGFLYVGDIQSGSGAVWRVPWVAGGLDTISAAQIVDLGDDRAVALAVDQDGPVPVLDIVTKGSTLVQRVDLSACTTVCTGAFVGSAQVEALSITHLDGAIYLAEPTGVTRIAAPGPLAAAETLLPGTPTAVGADTANGRLYVASAVASGPDEVLAVDPSTGATSSYVSAVPGSVNPGLEGVLGLAVAPGGDLVIADDPASAADPIGAVGGGRVWRMPLSSLNLPTASVKRGPPALGNRRAVAFEVAVSPGGAAIECRLDPPAGDITAGWTPCGQGSGSASYADLADGLHTFEARGVTPDGTGARVRATFEVDTRAPEVTVEGPASVLLGAPVVFRLAADEAGADLECRLNGGSWSSCGDQVRYDGLNEALHTFSARAVDLAGNVGAVRSAAVSVGTPTGQVAQVIVAPPAPRSIAVSPAGVLRRTVLRVNLNVPDGARVVNVVLRTRGGRGPVIARAAFRSLRAGPGHIDWRLRAGVARMVADPARRVQLTVRVGTGLQPVGSPLVARVRVAQKPPAARSRKAPRGRPPRVVGVQVDS